MLRGFSGAGMAEATGALQRLGGPLELCQMAPCQSYATSQSAPRCACYAVHSLSCFPVSTPIPGHYMRTARPCCAVLRCAVALPGAPCCTVLLPAEQPAAAATCCTAHPTPTPTPPTNYCYRYVYGKSTQMLWKAVGLGLMTLLPAMTYTLKVRGRAGT